MNFFFFFLTRVEVHFSEFMRSRAMAVYTIFFSSIHFYDLHPVDRMSTNKRSSVLTYICIWVRLLYDMMHMLICKAVNLPSPYKVTETQFPFFLSEIRQCFLILQEPHFFFRCHPIDEYQMTKMNPISL